MKSTSNSRFWLGLGILCLVLAPELWAQSPNIGCGYSPNPKASASLKPASLELVSDGDRASAPITGFWKIQLALPDGTVIDQGYATWHADGTEIINSSRPPISGNFCMGVWKRTGRSTYKLNHLRWGGTPVERSHWSHQPKGRGRPGPQPQQLRGTFTVDQYDVNGNVIGHATAGHGTADHCRLIHGCARSFAVMNRRTVSPRQSSVSIQKASTLT